MSDIECPYCGAKDDACVSDLWEVEGDENELECGSCEKTIIVSAEVSVGYKAERTECEGDQHEYGEVNRYDYEREGGFSIWFRDCKNCEHSDTEKTGYKSDRPERMESENE